MAVDAVARIALLHLNRVRVAPRLASIAWDAHSLARTSAELGERHDREEEEHDKYGVTSGRWPAVADGVVGTSYAIPGAI